MVFLLTESVEDYEMR